MLWAMRKKDMETMDLPPIRADDKLIAALVIGFNWI